MPTHIVNNPKLLDELLNFDSRAGLFINEVKENNENPTFTEPNFTGYALINLDKNKWGPAIKENDYASTVYGGELSWINSGNDIITINGYFIKKSNNNDVLWFNVFNNPVILNKNEGVYVTPTVYLNNILLLNTFFIFNIIKANPTTPTTLNPTISITNELWGDVSAENSLINTTTGNSIYSLTKNSIVLALDKKINPTIGLPFSFTLTTQQPGFFISTKLIRANSSGVYEKTIKLIEVG